MLPGGNACLPFGGSRFRVDVLPGGACVSARPVLAPCQRLCSPPGTAEAAVCGSPANIDSPGPARVGQRGASCGRGRAGRRGPGCGVSAPAAQPLCCRPDVTPRIGSGAQGASPRRRETTSKEGSVSRHAMQKHFVVPPAKCWLGDLEKGTEKKKVLLCLN